MNLTSELQAYLEREYGLLLDDRLLGNQQSSNEDYTEAFVSRVRLTEDQIRIINKGIEAYERYRHLI